MTASLRPALPAPRRRRLLAALACCAFAPAARAADDYPEIRWDELVPRDWDPMKSFEEFKGLGALSDFDPRMRKLYARLREVWDSAPTVPALAGRKVRLAGFLVPLEESGKGIGEFLLVPYFGACIHTPPPPANQIVHVRATPPARGLRSMDAVWVSGQLTLERADSSMGVAGYGMAAVRVVKYQPPAAR